MVYYSAFPGAMPCQKRLHLCTPVYKAFPGNAKGSLLVVCGTKREILFGMGDSGEW